MIIKKTKNVFFIILCFVLDNYAEAQPQYHANKTLVNYVYLGELSKVVARQVLQKTPPLDTLAINYDASLYKITYKTPAPDGQLTIASGLVIAPIISIGTTGIVSYQHGTRFNRDDVPSKRVSKNYTNAAVFANHGGYFTVMPDYLGLGDNALTPHPYMHDETLANSSVDMLWAAKELAALLNYPLNEQLYLTGYSEGGFSTLVMFELLSTQYKELPITGVALGSAPYDWEETINFIVNNPGPHASAYLAYFFYALQTYRQYWPDLGQIFIAPYDTMIPALFDGYHSEQEIVNALPYNPVHIFQPQFIKAILKQTERHAEQLKHDFNHYYFSPTAPLLIVSSKGDRELPYHGAEIAYQQFSKRGQDVFLKSVSDEMDHSAAGPYVLLEQVKFFQKLRPHRP